MAIEPISTLTAIQTVSPIEKPASASQVNFGDFLSSQIQRTDSLIKEAEHQSQLLAVGETDNLHQVMIALSKAKTEFELTVQMRNKLLESFQEVMRMQL